VVGVVSGGFRAAAGRKPDPLSGRSERGGYSLSALPNRGFQGKTPKFPLGKYEVFYVDGDGERGYDDKATAQFAKRERTIWRTLWHTPQACAWSLPEYAYLIFDIALYCRQLVICESSDAKAADRGLLPRYADRIGLSASGLAALGWKIVPDEVSMKRMEVQAEDETEVQPRRLRG
jgi:hypothetical protein